VAHTLHIVLGALCVVVLGCGDDEATRNTSHTDDAGGHQETGGASGAGGIAGDDSGIPDPPDAPTETSSGGSGGQAGGGSGSGGTGGDPVEACPSLPPRPAGPSSCGDGWRDADTEECDDGNADEGDLCSASCRVLERPVDPSVGAVEIDPPPRRLGTGRHVVAEACRGFGMTYVEGTGPASVSLATFGEHGESGTVVHDVSADSTPLLSADPVLAAVPGNKYVVAWNDIGGDGDLLGIAMKLVDPAAPESALLQFANASRVFSQYDPDVVRAGPEIVVAWVDDGNFGTGSDVRFRRFDLQLVPLTETDETLAETTESESGVVLTPFGDGWAAAWRSASTAGEAIGVRSGQTAWQVTAGRAGPADDKPALVAIDAEHLLVVFTTQVSTNVFALKGALLDTAAPGEVESFEIVPTEVSEPDVSHSQPSVTRAGERVYLSWRSTSVLGNADAEELWLKEISWSSGSSSLTVDLSRTEVPLPRAASHRSGDQRVPGLATAALWQDGGIAAVWEDYGRVFGAGEGGPDVIVGLIPAPVLRLSEQGSRRE
jgi:cysteine-rich repeat protein